MPLDPYFAAAMLATTRAVMAILSSSLIVDRFAKKNCLIVCDLIMAAGTIILATFCYFNQDGRLAASFPHTRWLPILSILLMYVAYVCGIGSVPYALQVKNSQVSILLNWS